MKVDEKLESDSVNMIVSILITYPEIGTLHYEPEDETLKMTFILNELLEAEKYNALRKLLCDNVEAYYSLERLTPDKFELSMEGYDNTTFISLVRDIATLSKNEISLICTLIGTKFQEQLMTDGNMPVDEEEIGIQADFIDHMLKSAKVNHYVKKLIGIREEGKVLIFNK